MELRGEFGAGDLLQDQPPQRAEATLQDVAGRAVPDVGGGGVGFVRAVVSGRLQALECGYYDQSHFCREFKYFTGSTPTRFFRERLSVDVARFCLQLDVRSPGGSPLTAESLL